MINPGLVTRYQVTIGRLNTVAMAALVPDGYNDVLREPILVDSDADGIGETRRQETATTVDAQISTESWEALRMAAGGRAPRSEIEVVVDNDELAVDGLVEADGGCVFRPGDRLRAVLDEDGDTVMSFPASPATATHRPGLYISQVRPTGFMAGQNLVCLVFAQRDEFPDQAQGA